MLLLINKNLIKNKIINISMIKSINLNQRPIYQMQYVKRDQYINLNLMQHIMVNGWVIIGTVSVYNNGLMVLNMRVNGKIIRHVVKVYFNMLMAIYIKELGKIIRQMDMVYINIKMVSNMRDSGRMIINMDLEKKCVHILFF